MRKLPKAILFSVISFGSVFLNTAAQAAIINFTSTIDHRSNAQSTNGPTDVTNIILPNSVITNYSNSTSSSSSGYYDAYAQECQCYVRHNVSASGASQLTFDADLSAGTFSGSGSYSSSRTEYLVSVGGGNSFVDLRFDLTTEYLYTLTMTVAGGAYNQVQFGDANGYFLYRNDATAVSENHSGILHAGSRVLYVGIQGCTDLCFGGPSSNFSFDLQLTPVPIPPAFWLFGSALGLMGAMRRKISG